VTAGERLADFTPATRLNEISSPQPATHHVLPDGVELLRRGRNLVFHIARARTPMPKSTHEYIERVTCYVDNGCAPTLPPLLPG